MRASLLWILLWSFFYTIGMSLAKFLSKDINIFTLVFIRTTFGLFFLIPLIHKTGWRKSFIFHDWPLHLLRGCIACGAMGATYYAYMHLNLSLATTIGFSQPLIVSLMALLFLKESVTFNQWAALALGYTGVFIFVNPWQADWSSTVWIALLANLLASSATIISKKLTQKNNTSTLMISLNSLMILISGVLSLFHGCSLSGRDFLLLIIIAGFSTFSQYAYLRALKIEPASFVSPFEYTRLVFVIPISLFIFDESLTFSMVGGTILVVLSTFYLARQPIKGKENG